MLAHLDGQSISPNEGFLLRKAPGNTFYDFCQHIVFDTSHTKSKNSGKKGSDTTSSSRFVSAGNYEAPLLPRGFVFTLHLLTTWGDHYYVGLNAVMLFDADGYPIPASEISKY